MNTSSFCTQLIISFENFHCTFLHTFAHENCITQSEQVDFTICQQ